MKAFGTHIKAVNKTTGEIQSYRWKPIFANSKEDAESIALPYVYVDEEIKSNSHIDKSLLEYFSNVSV